MPISKTAKVFNTRTGRVGQANKIMDEEKEQQKETPKESANADPTGQVKEKLESEGLDPEEFDEDEQEELADSL